MLRCCGFLLVWWGDRGTRCERYGGGGVGVSLFPPAHHCMLQLSLVSYCAPTSL